jgi:N-acetylmuramoyl-L-alanine amidase
MIKYFVIVFIITNITLSYSVSADERYIRTNKVLQHFGVPKENNSQDFFIKLQGKPALNNIANRLRYFELNKSFDDFFSIVHGPNNELEFQAFDDKHSRKILDYSVILSKSVDKNSNITNFHSRLLLAQKNPFNQQLSGLKIALDPGHMGGKDWDRLSGNFVRDNNGKQLSEGVLTLEIALKLEEQLKELGAEVFLTRRDFIPVTSAPYEDFELRPYALKYFRESSLDEWFQSIISGNFKSQSDLYTEFLSTKKFQRIFSEPMRWQFFMMDEDLNARAEAINKFAPDISLIIHLDTDVTLANPTGLNSINTDGTKAFVIGAFNKTEFASKEDRKFFGLHLLDTQAWDASLKLSRSIVNEIHGQMNIDYKFSSDVNFIPIEPGIYARNLYLLRKLKPHVTGYVECLYYNNPTEFYALSQEDQTMMINGKNYFYSNRLGLIVNSLRDAVVEFVKDYN